MKRITNQEKQLLGDLLEDISKTLIVAMKKLDLKTHVEMTSESEGYRYVLRFDKEKI